jgi:hypothetical protein
MMKWFIAVSRRASELAKQKAKGGKKRTTPLEARENYPKLI